MSDRDERIHAFEERIETLETENARLAAELDMAHETIDKTCDDANHNADQGIIWLKRAEEAETENARLKEALEKIYRYRSDEPDWNMVMAIAGDQVDPQVAVPSMTNE